MARVERRQHVGDVIGPDRAAAQMTGAQAARLVEVVGGFLLVGEQPARDVQKAAAGLGEFDAPATAQERARLAGVEPQDLRLNELGGEPVLSVDIASPRGERFGGVRVRTRNAWFAARPSGTEPLNKIYAESFVGPGHLQTIQAEAQKALAALSPGG